MKKLFLLMAMLPLLFASCSKEVIDNPSEDEFYVVKFGLGGDLDVTYEPMTKAAPNDLYGIQVYSKPNIEETTANWAPYAYGLYDKDSDITIKLLKGYKYKFVATMVEDGKERLYKGVFYYPFYASGDGPGNVACSNVFIYTALTYMSKLGDGYSSLESGLYDRPNTYRYYGELEGFIPGESDNAVIKMKRTCFGIKFKVQGKNSGVIEVMIDGAPKINHDIAENGAEISEVLTFKNVKAAWASTDTYTEKVQTSINWYRTDGTVVPMGTHDIIFKHNITAVVKLDVTNDDTNTSIGLEIEEAGEMTEEDGGTISAKDF